MRPKTPINKQTTSYLNALELTYFMCTNHTVIAFVINSHLSQFSPASTSEFCVLVGWDTYVRGYVSDCNHAWVLYITWLTIYNTNNGRCACVLHAQGATLHRVTKHQFEKQQNNLLLYVWWCFLDNGSAMLKTVASFPQKSSYGTK